MTNLNAQQRISLTLGSTIVDVEMFRDRVDELTLQLAERDATIIELRKTTSAPNPPNPIS